MMIYKIEVSPNVNVRGQAYKQAGVYLKHTPEKLVQSVKWLPRIWFEAGYNLSKKLCEMRPEEIREITIPEFKQHAQANLTDALFIGQYSCEMLFSKKLMDLIEQLKVTSKYVTLPTVVYSTKEIAHNYFMFFFCEAKNEYLDWSRSIWRVTEPFPDDPLGVRRKEVYQISFSNLAELKSWMKEFVKSFEYTKYHQRLGIARLALNTHADYDDFFKFSIPHTISGNYVSERSKHLIEQTKVTGLDCKPFLNLETGFRDFPLFPE